MTVEYDPTRGTFYTTLCLKNTVISEVISKFEFYMLIFCHIAVRQSHKLGYFSPGDFHLDLPMGLTGVTGSLMTFFVVFYNGNVFSRYNKFYQLTKNLNENTVCVVMMLTRDIADQRLKRKLVKMILCSCFLFFFERTPSEDAEHGNISSEEWDELVKMGLLDKEQLRRIQHHCKELGKDSMPSLVLLHWSMKLYSLDGLRNHELEKAYWEVRRMQDDVVEMLELPMPWQYFHIMNMMMMLNLLLWGYSFALEESQFATLVFVSITAIFLGIRELSVALADPFGDDAADFPLSEWMSQLYVRVLWLCEDDWAASEMMVGVENKPLHSVPKGHSCIDLLTDLHNVDRAKYEDGEPVRLVSSNSDTGGTGGPGPKPKRPKPPGKVAPAQDGSGDYSQIPSGNEAEGVTDYEFAAAD